MSEKLITTRNRVVAKQRRCEGVYNRTGDLSVICFGEEEQRNECEAIKNRRKRYVACDDVAGVAGFDKASLVACNNFMSLLLRKRWTNRFESCQKAKQKNNRHSFVSVIFWLGWQDSNLRMQQSKCCVLPLDDTPICNFIRKTPPKRLCASAEFPMGWNIGFEPMVSSATNWRFNQLS